MHILSSYYHGFSLSCTFSHALQILQNAYALGPQSELIAMSVKVFDFIQIKSLSSTLVWVRAHDL